ncbi:MAG TPA: DUF2007 domain-containing protein [Bacillota bacterium]|jgi:hypothetical protein|nr:DUF2007 domain-containing protein [Peptococcaceae bacterium MAG4]NLW39057.1 DUF2007 domain-containing protein [Peptococcaceae bacterium]HPZ43148.1 DUF2007 domain-containing protein [Bacillota bacterium]HQD75886.1 DUF2007 domain-containing protein [Bacillota bacterium]HUM58399.1 DUF2007 domain-containing protein [Bacillota bacterium]
MFCPKCRYEYVAGIKECPKCREALVEELNQDLEPAQISEPQLKPGYSKPVTVFATADAGLLAVVKSILDGAGIKYFVRNELIQAILPVQSGAFNSLVEIQVWPEDAADARALLDTKDV